MAGGFNLRLADWSDFVECLLHPHSLHWNVGGSIPSKRYRSHIVQLGQPSKIVWLGNSPHFKKGTHLDEIIHSLRIAHVFKRNLESKPIKDQRIAHLHGLVPARLLRRLRS